MDKLQKAGVWLWYNKERMVLIAMLVTLGYRGYQVFSPPPPPNWERLQMPKDIFPEDPAELEGLNIELPGSPPVRPPMDIPGTYVSLYNKNPFWYYSGQQKNESEQTVTAEQLNITLLDIQDAGGNLRARLRTTSATKWYSENEQFEEFELLRINPDDNTVEISSERSGRTFKIAN